MYVWKDGLTTRVDLLLGDPNDPTIPPDPRPGSGPNMTQFTTLEDGTLIYTTFDHFSPSDGEIVAFRNGIYEILVDTAGPFLEVASNFLGCCGGALAVSDNGLFAFTGTTDDGHAGIYTGADPVDDLVISIGDTLFGSTITDFRLFMEGINDAGQIAFLARFADGTQRLLRADPVTEPGLMGLSAILLGWAASMSRRRR